MKPQEELEARNHLEEEIKEDLLWVAMFLAVLALVIAGI